MHARLRYSLMVAAALLALPASALAHVSVSGAAYANQNTLLTFGVGHGCEGTDTVAIEVSIPKEVSGVRGVPHGVFTNLEVKTDDAKIVTAVIWKKDSARDLDDGYYQLQLRAKMPDAPFSTVLFPTKQTCRAADGTETVVDWKATPAELEGLPEGEEGPEPAPALTVLPVRAPGWNKFTTKVAINDLAIFNDAEIVWVGEAAYSSNPTTTEQIKGEDDVTPLTKIAANAEIWVKY